MLVNMPKLQVHEIIKHIFFILTQQRVNTGDKTELGN